MLDHKNISCGVREAIRSLKFVFFNHFFHLCDKQISLEVDHPHAPTDWRSCHCSSYVQNCSSCSNNSLCRSTKSSANRSCQSPNTSAFASRPSYIPGRCTWVTPGFTKRTISASLTLCMRTEGALKK